MNCTLWKLVIVAVVGGMLFASPGCQSRKYYSPSPLWHSQVEPVTWQQPQTNDSINDNAPGSATIEKAFRSEAESLTPNQAAELAVLNHPALRTARAERGLACAQIIQAGILPNPLLSASFDTPSFGAIAGSVTADSQAISWDISKLRPRGALLDSANSNVAAVDMDIVWQEWQYAQAAKQAIYDLAALGQQYKALVDSQKTLEENLKIVQKAVDEGNLTIVDLSAVNSAAIDARTMTLALEQEIKQQQVVVNRATGRAPMTPVLAAASIEFPDMLTLPPEAELFAITDGRPDLEAIRRSYESQEAALRAAVRAQIPATSVSFTRASDTSVVGTLGAGISVDLQMFDRNQGAIARECALRNKIREQYNQQVFTARAEVDSALADIESIENQIAATQDAIPVFQNLVDTYDKAVKEKNANVLVYYLAFNDLTQHKVDLWRLRRQLVDARIALETSVGVMIDQ